MKKTICILGFFFIAFGVFGKVPLKPVDMSLSGKEKEYALADAVFQSFCESESLDSLIEEIFGFNYKDEKIEEELDVFFEKHSSNLEILKRIAELYLVDLLEMGVSKDLALDVIYIAASKMNSYYMGVFETITYMMAKTGS